MRAPSSGTCPRTARRITGRDDRGVLSSTVATRLEDLDEVLALPQQPAHIEVSAQTVPAPSTAKRPCRNRLPVPTFICTLIGSHHPTIEVTDMLDNLFKSFDGLLKEKHSLSAKADQLARNERTACREAEPRAGRVGLPRGPRLRCRFRPGPRGRQDAGAAQAAAVPEMRADIRSPAADVPASEGHAQCHGGRQEEGPEEDRVTPGLAPAVLDLGSARG